MTTSVTSALSHLPVEEPSWLHDCRGVQGRPVNEAAAFLAGLDDEDLGVFVLAYGYGMRLGAVAQTLRLDPAIALWRIQRALSRWGEEHGVPGRRAEIEVSVANLLRNELGDVDPATLLPAPNGRPSWRARDLVSNLDDEVQSRLAERFDKAKSTEKAVSGIGIGSIGLILLAIAGFAIFGVLRDQNPYWRGNTLMMRGDFSRAREAFLKAGNTRDARRQVALCWLAEGQFQRALDGMDADVRANLGSFAPHSRPLTETGTESVRDVRAILPRGNVVNGRPSFFIRPGPPVDLLVTVYFGTTTQRSMGKALPDTSDLSGLVEVTYPEDWPNLVAGHVEWRLGDEEPVTFTLLDSTQRQDVQQRVRATLRTRDVPEGAKDFLLGHYYRNKELYAAAADAFGRLVQRFPDAAHPRQQLDELSAALGVDASVFLR